MDSETVRKMYQLIDRLDADSLVDHFAEDAVLMVGNQDPYQGREAIHEAFIEMFRELDGVHHEVHDVWSPEGKRSTVFMSHADAYFRVRGCRGAAFVRGAIIFEVDNGSIQCARVLYDMTPVWDAMRSPDRVFEALDESFPASDSPGWTP